MVVEEGGRLGGGVEKHAMQSAASEWVGLSGRPGPAWRFQATHTTAITKGITTLQNATFDNQVQTMIGHEYGASSVARDETFMVHLRSLQQSTQCTRL